MEVKGITVKGKLISFRPEEGELEKFQKSENYTEWDSFYSVIHPWNERVVCPYIAEHQDFSLHELPQPGYRLTESVPDVEDALRDNGWEVTRTVVYATTDPEAEYQIFAIAYCKYDPLPIEESWVKKAERF